MVSAFITAILPVVIIAIVGAFLTKRTTYLEDPNLPRLVLNVGMPSLLLHSMLGTNIDFFGMGKLIFSAVLVLLAMVVITYLVLKTVGLEIRYYLPVLVNPNTGNLGIPIAYALLGEQGLAGAVIVSSIIEISHFTLGIGLMSGSFNPRKLLANPPVIALITGSLLLGANVTVPSFMLKVFDMLGSIAVPIMLLMLGRSLAQMKVKEANWVKLFFLSLYRPGIGLSIAWGIALIMDLTPLYTANLVIACSMPVAVLNYIFVTRFNGPANDVAGLTFLTLPTTLIALLIIKVMII